MNTKHQYDTPSATQVAVGIGVAFLSAKDHLETASVLIANKRHKSAYTEWLLGIEELGKIILYCRCLLEDESKRQLAWDQYRSALEDHRSKILAFTETLEYLMRLESKNFSFKFTFNASDPVLGSRLGSFVQFLVKTHDDGRLHHWLLSLRESANYTTINNGTVASPEKEIGEIPDGMLELVVELTGKFLQGGDLLFKEAFGPAYGQLQEHFRARKNYDRTTYADLERTLTRVIPAITEIARQSTGTVPNINPEYADLIKKVGKETGFAKLIALVWAIKKTFELAASGQILSGHR